MLCRYQVVTASLSISEAALQATVVELLNAFGYQHLHVRRSIGKVRKHVTATSIIGWPDLLAWRPGRIVAMELKSDVGKVTPEQQAVLESLNAAGVESRVIRPADWLDLVEWLR